MSSSELERIADEVRRELERRCVEAEESLRRRAEELRRRIEEMKRRARELEGREVECPVMEWDADEPYCPLRDDEEALDLSPGCSGRVVVRDGGLWCPALRRFVGPATLAIEGFRSLLRELRSIEWTLSVGRIVGCPPTRRELIAALLQRLGELGWRIRGDDLRTAALLRDLARAGVLERVDAPLDGSAYLFAGELVAVVFCYSAGYDLDVCDVAVPPGAEDLLTWLNEVRETERKRVRVEELANAVVEALRSEARPGTVVDAVQGLDDEGKRYLEELLSEPLPSIVEKLREAERWWWLERAEREIREVIEALPSWAEAAVATRRGLLPAKRSKRGRGFYTSKRWRPVRYLSTLPEGVLIERCGRCWEARIVEKERWIEVEPLRELDRIEVAEAMRRIDEEL